MDTKALEAAYEAYKGVGLGVNTRGLSAAITAYLAALPQGDTDLRALGKAMREAQRAYENGWAELRHDRLEQMRAAEARFDAALEAAPAQQRIPERFLSSPTEAAETPAPQGDNAGLIERLTEMAAKSSSNIWSDTCAEAVAALEAAEARTERWAQQFDEAVEEMKDITEQLCEALEGLLKHVHKSTDPLISDCMWRSPSTLMREQADRIERMDHAITQARAALEAAKKERKP